MTADMIHKLGLGGRLALTVIALREQRVFGRALRTHEARRAA